MQRSVGQREATSGPRLQHQHLRHDIRRSLPRVRSEGTLGHTHRQNREAAARETHSGPAHRAGGVWSPRFGGIHEVLLLGVESVPNKPARGERLAFPNLLSLSLSLPLSLPLCFFLDTIG